MAGGQEPPSPQIGPLPSGRPRVRRRRGRARPCGACRPSRRRYEAAHVPAGPPSKMAEARPGAPTVRGATPARPPAPVRGAWNAGRRAPSASRRWAGGPRRLRSAPQRRQDVGEGAGNAVERARDLWGHRRDRVRPEPSTPTGPPRGCCRISSTTSPAGGPRPNVTPVSSSATRAPTCPAGGSRPNATVPGRRQRRISASRTRAPVHRPSRSPARPDHDRPGRSPTPAARGTTKKEARWCRKERMCAWEIRSAACSARS